MANRAMPNVGKSSGILESHRFVRYAIDVAAEFRLLGEVKMILDGREVELGHARQRTVFAILLLNAGHPVTVDDLLERVWGDDLPNSPHSTLHGYLSRLRRILARADGFTLARRDGGYVFEGDRAAVDVHRFRDLSARARAAIDDQEAMDALAAAFSLWRGTALPGLSTAWIDRVRASLEQERFAAELDRNDIALRVGGDAELLGDMATAAAAHPMDERLATQFMTCLVRNGRRAEALGYYEGLRLRMREELGVDPSRALQTLHLRMLSVPPPSAVAAAEPRQLPGATPHFVGRTGALTQLSRLLDLVEAPGRTSVVAVVHGAAGAGKTTLAIQWAHLVEDRFPDGQLYADLRGFDPSVAPVAPAEVLRSFLIAFGMAADQTPGDVDDQAALVRSVLAQKRVLVVLDNARDAEQVRPLLPGAPGAMVVITSRDRLLGLASHEGACLIDVPAFDDAEAHQLLARRLGGSRVAAEPDAVRDLVDRSGRLPLALAVLTARAAANPTFPLSVLADELNDERTRLDALEGGESRSSVRASISWSHRHLGADAAAVLRSVSLHPGPDVSLAAVSSIRAQPITATRALLTTLTSASLVNEPQYGRFTVHDLVRAYAAERPSFEDVDVARLRMLDHYLHTAGAAAALLQPLRARIDLPAATPGTTPERITDYAAAWTWFGTELPVLRTMIEHAVAAGHDRHAWQLAWTLSDYLDRLGRWHDWIVLGGTALSAAHRLRDTKGIACAHRSIGQAYTLLRAFDLAQANLSAALEYELARGDAIGQACVHRDIALMLDAKGAHAEALAYGERALAIFREHDDVAGEAAALNQVGWYLCQLGATSQALEFCERALALHRRLGQRVGEGVTWDSLGFIRHHLGDDEKAVDCYQRALELYREFGDRFEEAATLSRLAAAQRALGDRGAALVSLTRALTILDDLRHPDAAAIRAELAVP